jgi:DNA-binding response OmpR family regulator
MTNTEPRILLVDDEVDLRTEIANALEGTGRRIEQYGDVCSAAEAVQKAGEEGWDYDAAILDFCLPRYPGDVNAPVDETLCNLLRSGTVVWHISAHSDEAAVTAHLCRCHSTDQNRKMVRKSGGFVRHLAEGVDRYLKALARSTPSIPTSAPKVLVVEADELLRERLRRMCTDSGWSVDAFSEFEPARDAVEKAKSDGWAYEAAVIQVHEAVLAKASDSESVCALLPDTTLVWHTNEADACDFSIQESIHGCHSADESPRIIRKDISFLVILGAELRQALATRRIKSLLDVLRYGQNRPSYLRRFRLEPDDLSTTVVVDGLCSEIASSWGDLHPNFQRELRELFAVNETNGVVSSVYPK